MRFRHSTEGVEIDRVTLADWTGRAAWWLAPIASSIGTYVMAQPVLHTDDTPIRVLAPGTGKTRLARFGSMPWISGRMPAAILRPRSTATPPIAAVSGRVTTSPGSAASCKPTLSQATMPLPA